MSEPNYWEPWSGGWSDAEMCWSLVDNEGNEVASVPNCMHCARIERCVNSFTGVENIAIDAIAAAGGVAGLLEILRELYYEQQGRHVNQRAQALLKAIEGKQD